MKVPAKNAPCVRANEGTFNELDPFINGGLPILKLVLETKAVNTAIRKNSITLSHRRVLVWVWLTSQVRAFLKLSIRLLIDDHESEVAQHADRNECDQCYEAFLGS